MITKNLMLTMFISFLFSDEKLKNLLKMDLIAKAQDNNYSKVSSDDSEDGHSSSMFEIDAERSKDVPSIMEEETLIQKNVFIRRPAMNQVNNFFISY
jgi:hypothetical protein